MRKDAKLLPPDPDNQNLAAFMNETGSDNEDALCDLLCDLMHLCDRKPVLGTFAVQLQRAQDHYEAETGSEEG